MPRPPEFEVELFGESDDSELRDGIGPTDGSADEPGNRSGVHYVGFFARGDHPRDEAADAVDDAPEVNIDDPSPVIQREFPRSAGAAADARVVAEDVDSAEALVGGFGKGFDVLLFRDIGPAGEYLDAPRRDGRFGHCERLGFDIADDDVDAGIGEALSHGEPKAARSSCDNSDFAFEAVHGAPSVRAGQDTAGGQAGHVPGAW